jgi:hypothetical protein
MASDYGLNFGFRRSDESMATREGRLKTPVGSALKLGTAVEQDAATGYLKQCSANAAPLSGIHGLLVQEEIHIRSVYEASDVDSFNLGVARPDKLSAVWSGQGVKVWFKNSASQTRADGRSIGAVTIVDVSNVAVGDGLGWDGTKWVKSDGSTTPHWFRVTAVSGSGTSAYVEAVLQF